MGNGLNVSRIVNVTVNLKPNGAARRNFGAALIVGSSSVIPPSERIRAYSAVEDIAADFGLQAPEYLAAVWFFSQRPKPKLLQIGRWLQAATAASLTGVALTANALKIATWTAIKDGAVTLSVDGTDKIVSNLDFSAAGSILAVAGIINQAGEANGFSFTYDETNTRFIVTSLVTGVGSQIGYASAGEAGTDISELAGLTEPQAGKMQAGLAAESAAECASAMMNFSNGWYFLNFASTLLKDSDHMEIASLVEAASTSRQYFYTTQNKTCLDASDTSNVGYKLKVGKYNRTCGIYSSKSPYAATSFMGRASTVDFNGNNTVITMKFKQFVGVPYEDLTEAQAQALAKFNLNVYVAYNNDTAIVQEGVQASGWFFDEVFGLDWLQNATETNYYNKLYSSNRVPQTNGGMTLLINACESAAEEGVRNGLIAPGKWNSDGFGQLKDGDYLAKGYYFYSDLVENQDQSLREQRLAMPIQGAVKLAGAVHFGDVAINVNR